MKAPLSVIRAGKDDGTEARERPEKNLVIRFPQSPCLLCKTHKHQRKQAPSDLPQRRLTLMVCVFAVQGHSDAVGGAQEDQRVVLVLGGHVALHQHQPAVAARRAERRRLLRLPGRAGVQRTEGANLHQPRERQSV